MPSITANQVRCYQDDPVLAEIVKCSSLRTPELEFIPSTIIPGTGYDFWKRSKRIDTPIYVKECEGACAEQAGWEKTHRELAKMLRVMESCEGAITTDNNGTRQALPVWDETRMEEMENIRRKMAQGVYSKEDDESSPYNLNDFTCLYIDALQEQWNLEQDFDGAALLAAGGLTTVYLINASLGGLHWAFGNGREFSMSGEEFISIRDEDKSQKTGKNCTYPGIVQYTDSYHSIVAKCEFDVIAICNVPCDAVDKFFLDTVIGRVVELVYDNTSISPNIALMPSIAKRNWFDLRKKQGLEAGGCCFGEVSGSSNFTRLPLIEDLGVTIVTTPNIPEQTEVKAGNVDAVKGLYDNNGDLKLGGGGDGKDGKK